MSVDGHILISMDGLKAHLGSVSARESAARHERNGSVPSTSTITEQQAHRFEHSNGVLPRNGLQTQFHATMTPFMNTLLTCKLLSLPRNEVKPFSSLKTTTALTSKEATVDASDSGHDRYRETSRTDHE